MRQFEIAVGGHTPKHTHPYEHEVFVLEGEGVVLEGDHEHALRSGDVVYVQPDEMHQFRNTGSVLLEIPLSGPQFRLDKNVTVAPECGN